MPLDVVKEDEQKQNRKSTREFLEEAHRDDEDSTFRGPEPQQVAHFEAVTAAFRAVLSDEPSIEVSDALSQEEQQAIECLYAAKTGTDPEQGQFRSAVARSAFLNQALAKFQPILALGLEPEFLEGRAAYDELKGKVSELRHHLSQRFLLEGGAGKAKKKKSTTDKKDDTTPPEGDDKNAGTEAETETETETETEAGAETEAGTETGVEADTETEAGEPGQERGIRGWARRLVNRDGDD
jgi:hypothetical protein